MQGRMKNLDLIEGLEDYPDYAVDTEGNVWSFKYKRQHKLSPGWKRKQHPYLFVRLSDKYGNKKNFNVHRLVALAFIPTDDTSLQVNHINRNQCDNRIENLEWCSHKQNTQHCADTNGFKIDEFLTGRIKQVHAASIRKGLPVPDAYAFMNSIIEGALEDYINQYGLRKVM
jgi:hypothetical protein